MPRRPALHVLRVEEEQLIGLTSLSVINSLTSRLPPPAHYMHGRGDDTWDENEQQEQPPLGVKLTGYRLLVVGVISVFGVTKASLACCGQSSALTTLDWVAGTSMALMYGPSCLHCMVGVTRG